MALTTTDDAPGIVVDDWKILLAAWGERVVEIVAEPCRLLPSIIRIAKKHAKEMTTAGIAVVATICLTSMHYAKVVDELYVALLAVKLRTEPFRKFLDGMQSMKLLGCDVGHTGVAVNERRSQEWRFHELAYGLALGEEKRGSVFEVWRLVPSKKSEMVAISM